MSNCQLWQFERRPKVRALIERGEATVIIQAYAKELIPFLVFSYAIYVIVLCITISFILLHSGITDKLVRYEDYRSMISFAGAPSSLTDNLLLYQVYPLVVQFSRKYIEHFFLEKKKTGYKI